MLSRIVRLGHSIAPRSKGAEPLHGIACPVGGLRHREKPIKYRPPVHPRYDGIVESTSRCAANGPSSRAMRAALATLAQGPSFGATTDIRDFYAEGSG